MAAACETYGPTYKHRVTFNPNKASPGKTLYLSVPKLDDRVVLVPGSLALVFNLIVSGQTNNFPVNNVSRALVSQLVVKFAGKKLQETKAYDNYNHYEDLFLSKDLMARPVFSRRKPYGIELQHAP